MAKRTTNPGSWRWPNWFQTASLLAGLGAGNPIYADEIVRSNSPPPATTTALLDYCETDFNVNSWGVSLTPRTMPFQNEPAATSGKTLRGVLNFGGGPGNSVSFIWQRDARKVFLDLKRNGDFTNDAADVFSAREAGSVNYQTFTNVHLLFNLPSGKCPVLADISFYDYSLQPSCELMVRSFWEGKVTLQGQDWQVGIVQNDLRQPDSFENSRLLRRPWAERSQPFNTYESSLATVPFTQKVFVDGHAYQLDLAAQTQNGAARPALRFTEESVPLGDLKITGKFIQRLVLPGGTYQVVLDRPAGTVKVPTGNYGPPQVRLEQGGTEAYVNSSQPISGGRISVNGKTPAILDAGGPLTNFVIVKREGQDLRLDYQLIGAGGTTYQLANRQPPAFAIYSGNRQIASGNFEFG